ncbi:ATP-binding protein [Halosquirtibacter laminarini]|uniref:ATP-binding protein n=1 Tax=Halosquirtibacter laminarini TaxID=3374600 RepID=A0AC61NIH8_9BACT|nr:ATP-binding protein [Prolixibacteraceae bacterium]
MEENSIFDRKSLKLVQGKTADWDELAKVCVAFANATGGEIHIGIEDDKVLPDPNHSKSDIHQRIGVEIHEKKLKRSLDKLIKEGVVNKIGEKKGTKYELSDKS